MEDKLVTLAILTYTKAQILKNVLENEGIETYIHNVNQIQPVVSSGVRLRIKESDLPHALKITESSAWLSESIVGEKETKKGEKQVDIRPFIYKMELQENDRIFLSLASASANYTKPDAVMDAFTSWLGQELPEFACMIHRLEVYADLGNEKKHKFVSLESLGVEVQ